MLHFKQHTWPQLFNNNNMNNSSSYTMSEYLYDMFSTVLLNLILILLLQLKYEI
jgi:hypothetical protein